MTHIRSISATIFATGLVIFASSGVLANSEINQTREARRAYCQNEVPDFMKGQCMKQTAQTIKQYRAEHQACMRSPGMTKSDCDTALSSKLGTLNTGSD
jgi:hypothetical protein